MVEKDEVSKDFRKQVLGCGLTIAESYDDYASGLYSSRRIAKACRERNDFVMIVALDPPDFRTISDFRKRHLKALGELFLQVLKLCETAGLDWRQAETAGEDPAGDGRTGGRGPAGGGGRASDRS